MRMWKVDPQLLCQRHLLGEHVEMHMFVGCLRLGKSLTGYIKGGLVEIENIAKRHDDIVSEMIRRGMNHRTPIKPLPPNASGGFVDVNASVVELARRCENCAMRQRQHQSIRSTIRPHRLITEAGET